MRVIRVRVCVRRALWSWLALLALMFLLLLLEPAPPATHSPYRHVPADYMLHRARLSHLYNRSGCVSPPDFTQIQFSAAFWQRVTSHRESAVLVFAAYWDDRADDRDRDRGPLGAPVRLLVHGRQLPQLHCLFWYYNVGDPVTVEALAPRADSETRVHVVTCTPLSRPGDSPAAVSVVAAAAACGKPKNILGIQGIPKSGVAEPGPAAEGRSRFAVCTVWWRRGDAAVRLAEWLQMLRYFRVSRVYFYINHNAHVNVLRVIDYYSSQHAELDGMKVDIMAYTSPPINDTDYRVQNENTDRSSSTAARGNDFEEYSEVTWTDGPILGSDKEPPPIYEDDLLPYNECIYRAMLDRIDWVAPLDLDEIILPARGGTWEQLASKESYKAKFKIDELPDVLEFQRWWFPELLQTDLTTSTQSAIARQHLTNEPAAGDPDPLVSRAPLAIPPGRIFAYEWRGPTARAEVVVTGKLLRVGSVASVGRRGARCRRRPCRVRAVDAAEARVHLYTWGSGGARRGVCRALRRSAVRAGALWRWRRAQQEAALALRRLQLHAHTRDHADDL